MVLGTLTRSITGNTREISKSVYFAQHVLDKDREPLRKFISEFPHRLQVPSTLLAVGSSTFPLSYWNEANKKKREQDGLVVHDSYKDIDILVIPEFSTCSRTMFATVEEALKSLGFAYERKVGELDGRTPNKHVRKFVPRHVPAYGPTRLQTKLASQTPLELIIAHQDRAYMHPVNYIKKERKENTSFSILYQP